MRAKFRDNLRRTLVFVSVLALIASSALLTGYADDKVKQDVSAEVSEVTSTKKEPTIHVDNHSRQMPALTGSKMKLSDPHFSDKEWFEYVEYIGNDSDLQIAGRTRKLMRRIGMWASAYQCAVVLIGHFSKRESAKDLYRGLGSIDVVAAAQSVLQVERSEEDDEIRIVRQVKNSLDSKGADLSFEIRPTTGFHWLDVSDASAAPLTSSPTFDTLPKNKHELAAILIKRALQNGAVESMEIRRLMSEYRIGEKTMNEVKTELGIKPYKKMRTWYWVLPGTDETKGELR